MFCCLLFVDVFWRWVPCRKSCGNCVNAVLSASPSIHDCFRPSISPALLVPTLHAVKHTQIWIGTDCGYSRARGPIVRVCSQARVDLSSSMCVGGCEWAAMLGQLSEHPRWASLSHYFEPPWRAAHNRANSPRASNRSTPAARSPTATDSTRRRRRVRARDDASARKLSPRPTFAAHLEPPGPSTGPNMAYKGSSLSRSMGHQWGPRSWCLASGVEGGFHPFPPSSRGLPAHPPRTPFFASCPPLLTL